MLNKTYLKILITLQSASRGSPLTFTIEGEESENEIEVVQSAPDDNSPLQVKIFIESKILDRYIALSSYLNHSTLRY